MLRLVAKADGLFLREREKQVPPDDLGQAVLRQLELLHHLLLLIELARAVYFTNDVRAAIKRRINTALGSVLVEEKSYSDYTRK